MSVVEREAVEAEELLDQQRELVGGALGVGRDAPVVDELVAGVAVAVEPDHGLGVADVDGEQHGRQPAQAVGFDVEADVEHRRRVR